MKLFDTLDLLSPPPDAILGNHGIWLPSLGIKVPFQWAASVTKRTKQEAGHSRNTIADEIGILRALADLGMAPPVGGLVFFRDVISDYPGAWHCDPCGAYGYEIADATTLPPGRFDIEAMRALPIEGSPGAWGDVAKPGNVVNGYLVDVRRSAWDMLRWLGPHEAIRVGHESVADLAAKVHRECQFPAGERAEAYQDFWIGGNLQRGQRRVVERAQALGFAPAPGESILDVGCQSGGFLQYAHAWADRRGTFVGVESEALYVDCARALARSCGQNISIRHMNVVQERDVFLAWVQLAFPRGVDHLLLLSIEKHVGEAFVFGLVDEIRARHAYIETNAVAFDDGTAADPPAGPMKLWPEIERRGGRHVGDSRDRNLRRLYRIDWP